MSNSILRLRVSWGVVTGLLLLCASLAAEAQTDFVAFESGHVRPVAMSPNGQRLFAVNTPDNRLEVFEVTPFGLSFEFSVQVGMEPVAVAPLGNDEVWVVNHLSDSISIIDLTATPPRVSRTLLVGDEPRDIVFAGKFREKAFITTAHRGQHRDHPSLAGVPGAGDPQLTTAGIGRADVWVFDSTNLGGGVGGTPIEILTFFADTPRALAVSPDGRIVYVAAFHSGNQTTAITETLVPDGFDSAGPSGGAPGGVPGPDDNAFGDPAPETGVIVKFDGTNWKDAINRNWDALVPFDLPDHDVFAINAVQLTPALVPEYDHVGTILFNMAVNPANGKIFVTNTELPNHVRFEGPGVHGGSTTQGHLSESRISVLDPTTGSVDTQHLNKHIDYSKLHTDIPDLVDPTQIGHSLATPLQPVFTNDGSKLYVAAFGSAKIGVFDTADIEDPNFEANFDPTTESANYITTPSGGPTGLALDEARGHLYVLTRFDNSVAVMDLDTGATLQTHSLHNPEPQSVVDGRPFLYDAVATSGNGEASCSSCHIFADFDSLAWNLGDPDGASSTNTQPSSSVLPPATTFHPMKGPMTTQTLRGMATHGALHWRGDRVDGFFGLDPCTEPTGAPCDEDVAFRNFIVAFEGLVGHEGLISETDMQKFSDFILQVVLPPNPIRNLDNSLTSQEQDGETFFSGPTSDTVATCEGCHDLAPGAGFFGTGGEQSFEGEPQNMKVAHMRNLYQKLGMFSVSGDQVRGFGMLHDGSVDTVKTFLEAPVFSTNNAQERDLEAFSLAFPSDLPPVVGQQVTRTAGNAADADPRIDLLMQRADASFASLMLGGTVTECDLVVKGTVGGLPRGWLYQGNSLPVNALDDFADDAGGFISDAGLRALAASEGPLTYTCAPAGSGTRMAINRDGDALLDGVDNCPDAAGANQADFDVDGRGDICDDDDDNDGLLDVVETDTGTLLSDLDTGTNPFNPDTDGDGWDDGIEVQAGSDPHDAASLPPFAIVPILPVWGLWVLAGSFALLGGLMVVRRRV